MSKVERKTASGHRAGVHSASSFGEAERSLKRAREEELAEFNAKHAGQNSETVYRDKRGRKLDMLNEFMKQQSINNGEAQKQELEQAQYEWGKGSVQKKELEETKREIAEIASEPFARTADNPRLEKMRKEAVRDGDPMAQYFAKKKDKQSKVHGAEEDPADYSNAAQGTNGTKVSRKPPYRGPTPAPNRFGIPPGYRWDAVDRGNKFEQKVMLKMNDRGALKEDEYKWSVSDL